MDRAGASANTCPVGFGYQAENSAQNRVKIEVIKALSVAEIR